MPSSHTKVLFGVPNRLIGMDIQHRRDILQREIASYVKNGFIVVSQTDTTAQLIKHKKFSFLWAVLWFLVFGIGLIVYLIWYAAKRDTTVYVTVDESGKVQRR